MWSLVLALCLITLTRYIQAREDPEEDEMQHISTTATTTVSFRDEENQRLGENLFQWIRENGGYVNPKLKLSTGLDASWNVRGIFTEEFIEEGDLLAHIPKSVMICAGVDGNDCDIAALLVQEMELGNRSFYWPYLQILEAHEPVVFGEEEAPLLEGLPPYNFFHIQERTQQCGFDFNDPLWRRATALVFARIMAMDELCMIPFWDSFNHHRIDQNIQWEIDEQVEKIQLTSHADIQPGAQVWSEFNQDTPSLFASYGFVEPRPNVWYFDGTDDVRYHFDLDDQGIEIHPQQDGTLQSLHMMGFQMGEVLRNLQHQDEQFKANAVAYKGPDHLLELIKAYRTSFMSAIETGALALLRDL